MQRLSSSLIRVTDSGQGIGHLGRSRLFSSLWLVPVVAMSACSGSETEEAVVRAKQAVTAPRTTVTAQSVGWGSANTQTYQQVVVAAQAKQTTSKQAERTVWVMMKQKPSLAVAMAVKDWKGRGQQVHAALRSQAAVSQASLLSFLDAQKISHKSFWIANTVKVKADAATIDAITKRSDVAKIIEDGVYTIPPVKPMTLAVAPRAIEWNIANIRAPQAWNDFGTRGEGVIIASIDTGVDYTHPALARQYRGLGADGTYDHNYNWYDPSNVCGSPSTVPCDNAGHGTHTMGTMVGDDGGDNQIGVAPGAKFITAKGCEDYSCSFDALLDSGQWMLAPTDLSGNNPRPDLRPHIVSNSWGGGGGDDFYREIVTNWIAAGIFPVFASGNSGPYCGSSGSPGDYPEAYSVGGYDSSLSLAYFSSRGASAYGVIKPNIAAPGVDVRSSVPGGGYESYQGTSMATPHVAGAVALMWSASPALAGDIEATRGLLDESAIDRDDSSCGGTPENNNSWGEGMLDAYRAIELAPRGPMGEVSGTVSQTSGSPIPGAKLALEGPLSRTTYAGSDGFYKFKAPVGFYSVTASSFAFYTQRADNVEVAQDVTTTKNFVLEAAPAFPVTGNVRDDEGEPVEGATVRIAGTPLLPVVTDATGAFSFATVPAGEYQLVISAGGCLETTSLKLVVDANETVPVTMPSRTDDYGYQCRIASFDYIPGTDPVYMQGETGTASITLPFSFMLYGKRFEKAIVSPAGYLSFSGESPYWDNLPIPDPTEPNSALFAFWDDNYMDGESSAATAVVGTAPNRKFVMEWRNVAVAYDFGKRNTFEMVLSENGEMTFQYLTLDSSAGGRGGSATVGIENSTGTVGHQYSYNQATLSDGLAVRYAIPHAGIVEGVVTDANDGLAVKNASVDAVDASGKIRSTTTDDQGRYAFQIRGGIYTLAVSKKNYGDGSGSANISEGQTIIKNFTLSTPRAEVNPTTVQLLLPVGVARTRTITLANTGSLPLTFTINESGGKKQTTASSKDLIPLPVVTPGATTTKERYDSTTPPVGWAPMDTGDTLFSFTPASMQLPWGVGFMGNLWLSDAYALQNREFTTTGSPTGAMWSTPWAGYFPGDMAYLPSMNRMCQVAVGGDNGIHCWDPATGAVTDSISGSFPWTRLDQRGLAYRSDDDSFYIGGWNEGVIYHVQGLNNAQPGAVISSCMPPDYAISGLAYNDAMGVLWQATNSMTDTIYQLNPEDCTVLSTLKHPQPGGYRGAGLEMDTEGNLWTVGQSPGTAYLIDSGVPAFSDVAWLAVAPSTGTVAAAGKTALSVSIDTRGMEPGVYLASLFVASNSGRQERIRVPVSLIVTAYQRAVNAGGKAFNDANDDPWVKDQAYSEAATWGFVQRGTVQSTNKKITGTVDQALYQSQREDPYAYRFDSVPNGVYEIDLRSAELSNTKLGKRLFDVIVENTVVLPAHDIVYEVGSFTADSHKFLVEVTDNRLDVRFVQRAGSKSPVINALRVTQRPDR